MVRSHTSRTWTGTQRRASQNSERCHHQFHSVHHRRHIYQRSGAGPWSAVPPAPQRGLRPLCQAWQPPPFLLASARPPSFGEVLSATLGPYGLRLAVAGRGLTSPWIPPLRPPPYPHELRRSTPHWPVVTLQRGEAAPKARSHGARGQKHTRLENRDCGAHSCKGRSRQLPMLVNPDLRR